MRSNNNHEAITHLAMPERQIPVLIDSSPEKAEGYVTSTGWSEKPQTSVRRLQASFVDGLRNARKRREIEREHGVISATDWNQLRELLALIDRLNAGDWSPIVTTNAEEILKDFPALLNRFSPEGWFLEDEPGTGKIELRSASGNLRSSISINLTRFEGIEPGKPFTTGSDAGESIHKSPRAVRSELERGKKILEENATISAKVTTAACALSEAFTAGLSKTRFVVWWSDVGKKLVPGLYCPDIVTALYALAMWSSGTAGGWAICQKCGEDYPRSRAKQRYCSHRCQVAAAMKRHRIKVALEEKSKSKAPTKSKKRTGRK